MTVLQKRMFLTVYILHCHCLMLISLQQFCFWILNGEKCILFLATSQIFNCFLTLAKCNAYAALYIPIQLKIPLFFDFGFVPKKFVLGFPFVFRTLLRSVSTYEAGEESDQTETREAEENLSSTSLGPSQNSKKAEPGVELEFSWQNLSEWRWGFNEHYPCGEILCKVGLLRKLKRTSGKYAK